MHLKHNQLIYAWFYKPHGLPRPLTQTINVHFPLNGISVIHIKNRPKFKNKVQIKVNFAKTVSNTIVILDHINKTKAKAARVNSNGLFWLVRFLFIFQNIKSISCSYFAPIRLFPVQIIIVLWSCQIYAFLYVQSLRSTYCTHNPRLRRWILLLFP